MGVWEGILLFSEKSHRLFLLAQTSFLCQQSLTNWVTHKMRQLFFVRQSMQTSRKLHANLTQTSHKLHTNITQTSHKHNKYFNFTQNSHKLQLNSFTMSFLL
jgi:hypothetical protein